MTTPPPAGHPLGGVQQIFPPFAIPKNLLDDIICVICKCPFRGGKKKCLPGGNVWRMYKDIEVFVRGG